MKIEIGKTYISRHGETVSIIGHDLATGMMQGLVKTGHHKGKSPPAWNAKGTHKNYTGWDLTEEKPPKKPRGPTYKKRNQSFPWGGWQLTKEKQDG